MNSSVYFSTVSVTESPACIEHPMVSFWAVEMDEGLEPCPVGVI